MLATSVEGGLIRLCLLDMCFRRLTKRG